ncbi:hypothetical protein C2W62_06775 [Candidatus Entotheonella serta]|nr:hypothetical protein C2W62_06775 [Candidatus Entotheonella serta]
MTYRSHQLKSSRFYHNLLNMVVCAHGVFVVPSVNACPHYALDMRSLHFQIFERTLAACHVLVARYNERRVAAVVLVEVLERAVG